MSLDRKSEDITIFSCRDDLNVPTSNLTGNNVNLPISARESFAFGQNVCQYLPNANNLVEKRKWLWNFLKKKDATTKHKFHLIKSFSDIPSDIQKKISECGITVEECEKNLELICNILHFLFKDIFLTPEMTHKRLYKPSIHASFVEQSKHLFLKEKNLKKHYRSMEITGKGGFGNVYNAKDSRIKRRVAIKKLDHRTPTEQLNNYTEVAFLSSLCHPNIVRFLHAYEFPSRNEAWIITEFMEGGNLSEAIKAYKFSENHIAYITREILQAINYLHSKNYAHRDLKASNVMMSIEGRIKLIDFGSCCDLSMGKRVEAVGSPFWMPPEMVRYDTHDCSVDIWSLGVCVLEIYNKKPPNSDSKILSMFRTATEGLKKYIPADSSSEAKDFLNKCLEMNPKDRPTASQLLSHPFIKKKDIELEIKEIIKEVFFSNYLATAGI